MFLTEGEIDNYIEKGYISDNSDDPWLCLDCQTETDCYMLHDWLWEALVPAIKGHLCIPCLEKRLNLTLTREFFSEAPINDLESGDPVLAERLSRKSEYAAFNKRARKKLHSI